MRKIPYGEIDFETVIKNNLLYIDKTSYIEKLESDIDLKKTLYLRPGRFGKSLFTSMLNYYYAIDAKEKFQGIFGNTYIGKHPTENKNKYYILKFDFSGMDNNSQDTLQDMQNRFAKKVKYGAERFIARYNIECDFEKDLTPAEILAKVFLEFETQKKEQKIYVLIDEYDDFTNGILKGDAGKFLDIVSGEGFVKAFYATIKENIGLGIVERFFATGIAPIILDSMTTGFNIATDITRFPEFVAMIGLTKQEVKYIKREDAKNRKSKEKSIKEKRDEALEQIYAYCEDKRLPKENMKKFIVIYVGEKLELLEEVEI